MLSYDSSLRILHFLYLFFDWLLCISSSSLYTLIYIFASSLSRASPFKTHRVAWGRYSLGSILPPDDLSNIADASCGLGRACVARKNDGTGVAWGPVGTGGDASSVDLSNLADISCGQYACVARKKDDTGLAWGSSTKGGDASGVDLTNIADISCGGQACVALKNDGTAEAW